MQPPIFFTSWPGRGAIAAKRGQGLYRTGLVQLGSSPVVATNIWCRRVNGLVILSINSCVYNIVYIYSINSIIYIYIYVVYVYIYIHIILIMSIYGDVSKPILHYITIFWGDDHPAIPAIVDVHWGTGVLTHSHFREEHLPSGNLTVCYWKLP